MVHNMYELPRKKHILSSCVAYGGLQAPNLSGTCFQFKLVVSHISADWWSIIDGVWGEGGKLTITSQKAP